MSKTALITGASGGIGKELAIIHASAGDDLVLVARTTSKLETLGLELEKEYGVKVHTITKDLSENNASKELFDEISGKAITIDYLINNAGFGDFGMFAETDWNKQEKMINLNITALAHLSRLIIPGMINRSYGKILNVASLAAFQPGPSMSVYFASKAFVLSFSQALNNELKDKGITVTALCPGSTKTDFHAVTLGDPGLVRERKMDSAKDVAGYGYKAMMKGKPVVIYGARNRFIIFMTRFLSREFVVKMARKIQESKNAPSN